MAIIPIPPDETERMRAVERTGVLDSPREPAFDQIAELAVATCGTNIAAISIIDRDRQWFKAIKGLAVSETPRDISFCQYTIVQSEPFVVEDALLDSRFRENPLVLDGPRIRFYAGVRLISQNGHALGALCVIHPSPMRLGEQQMNTLRLLARQAELLLDIRAQEREFRSLASRLSSVVESMHGAILAKDQKGHVIFANSAFCRLFKASASPELITGAEFSDFSPAIASLFANPEYFLRSTCAILEAKKVVNGETFTMADGRTLERDYVPTFVGNDFQGHMWVYRDVTARKNAERTIERQRAQMAVAARLSALGEMAAGIAHEINNPLAIIRSSSQLLSSCLEKRAPGFDQEVRLSAKINDTTTRIAKIVSNLRSLGKADDKEPLVCCEVKSILHDTLELCAARFRENRVSLEVGAIPEGVSISCRPVMMVQVLLNLLNNAFDAVKDLAEKWVDVEVHHHGSEIEIYVTDSGEGIPQAIRDRIMEPFFTTKDVGSGTGLGLSLARTILERHGGTLSLMPEYRHTRFVVRLPVALAQPESGTTARAG